MGIRQDRFQGFSTQTRSLFTLIALLSSSWVAAAPVLVDETPGNGELPKDAWFYDVPVAMDLNVVDEAPIDDIAIQSAGSVKQPVTPPAIRQGPIHSPYRGLPTRYDANFEQPEALRELLRSYLNTSKVVGGVINQSIARAVPQSSTPAYADPVIPFAGRAAVDEILAKAVSMVIQPGMSERGLMTFSILGLGEFALVRGGGITLSLGEALSFSILGAGPNVAFPGAFTGGGAGTVAEAAIVELSGVPMSVGDNVTEASGTAAAAVATQGLGGIEGAEAATGGQSEGAKSSSGRGQDGGPHLPRILVLVYDILTYPGTLLTLFVLSILQLTKVGKKLGKRTVRRYPKEGVLAERFDNHSPMASHPPRS